MGVRLRLYHPHVQLAEDGPAPGLASEDAPGVEVEEEYKGDDEEKGDDSREHDLAVEAVAVSLVIFVTWPVVAGHGGGFLGRKNEGLTYYQRLAFGYQASFL